MKIAFLGLGIMGYPMAGHLSKHFETLIWNRTNAKAESHSIEYGTQNISSFNELSSVDVLFTCFPTSKEVLEIAPKILENAVSGLVWVDCTSGDPASARALSAMLEERQMHFLDAPVSGGVKTVIESFAAKIVFCGPSGAGMAVKAANQALLGVNILALSEVLLGLEKAGVKTSTALDVINASSGRSNVSMNLFPERVVGRGFPATFALGLMAKDVRIASQALREARVPSPITSLTENLLEIALRELGSDVDHVAAAQLLERWAGVELGVE
jgi:3-hydroxyisobutyrate dehydrogenase